MLRRQGRRCAIRDEDRVNLEPNQLGRQPGKSIGLSVGPAIFKGEVCAFDPAEVAQRFAKRNEGRQSGGPGKRREDADPRNPEICCCARA